MRASLLLYLTLSISLASCSVATSESATTAPTLTLAALQAATLAPRPTAAPSPTSTPHPSPGLIVTLGDQASPPYAKSIPVFSPDGKSISLVGSSIRIWDSTTFQLLREIANPYGDSCTVETAAFSPDGSLLVASTACWREDDQPGHLLVWDPQTGELLRDWTQGRAQLVYEEQWPYSNPPTGFAFVPSSSAIAFGNGSTIEIRDPLRDTEPVVLPLGKNMYATDISIREDGQFLYVLMSWDRTHDFPSYYRTAFLLQIWGLQTRDLRREIDFGATEYAKEAMQLLGADLIRYSFADATAQITDLTTDSTRAFLFRQGWKYYNTDHSLVAVARYFGFEPKEQGIELWSTDTWRNLYTFRVPFESDWYFGLHDIAFSPDNTTMAISHQEQLSLWDIGPITAP